jgi:hypothetical protein
MQSAAAPSASISRRERSAITTSATPAPPARDPLLDSAVARKLAAEVPPRVLKPAPDAGLPVPEISTSGAASVADRAAPTRVAVGRSAVRAQRDSAAGTAPDQLSAGRAAGRAVGEPTVAAARRADSIASPPAGTMAASAPGADRVQARGAPPGPECYRVESANGTAAAWGPVTLPLVVAVDALGHTARVLTLAGQPTDANASVTRSGEDSLLFRLRRSGFAGTLALGAAGAARAGVMRSRPLPSTVGPVAPTNAPTNAPTARPTTGRPADARQGRGARAMPMAKRAAQAPDSATASAVESAISAAPAVPVVARRIGCPP